MKTTLYNAAMDRVTMSEQCENEILEAAAKAADTPKKKHFKIRFIPVIAAAAVLAMGTLTVAADDGAFNWIKRLFEDKDFEITDEIAAMTSEMNNFSCVSEDEDIKLSPVGMIAESSTIYCLLNVDSASEDFDYRSIKLTNVCVNDFDPNEFSINPPKDIYGNKVEGESFGFGMEYNDDKTIAVKIFPTYKAFKDGDKITIKFAKISLEEESDYYRDTILSDSENIESYANVSFDLSMSDINCLETEYDTCQTINIDSYMLVAEKLTVSPLRVIISGTESSYISNSSPYVRLKDITITLKNGSEVKANSFGSYACKIDEGYAYDTEWYIERPISPDNISTIYLQGVCLYDCNEQ